MFEIALQISIANHKKDWMVRRKPSDTPVVGDQPKPLILSIDGQEREIGLLR